MGATLFGFVVAVVFFVAMMRSSRRRSKSTEVWMNETRQSPKWGSPVKMFLIGILIASPFFILTAFKGALSGLSILAVFISGVNAVVIYAVIWALRSRLNPATFLFYVAGAWYADRLLYTGFNLLYLSLRGQIPLDIRLYYSSPRWLIPHWQWPYTPIDIVAAVLVTGAAYYFILGVLPYFSARGNAAMSNAYGGTSMSKDETTRLLCASAWTSGRGFRKKVLESLEDPHIAAAPEVGVDINLVARVCKHVAQRDSRYDWLFLLIGAVTLIVILSVNPTLGIILGVAASTVLYLQKSLKERDILQRFFQRGKFDAAAIRERFASPIEPHLSARFPWQDQNLIVYSGFTPFIGAGINLGGWSFTVNLDKPPEPGLDDDGVRTPLPFEGDQLYAAIDEVLEKLKLERLDIRDLWFVSGAEIRQDSTILPNIYGPPVQKLDTAAAAEYRRSSDSRIRHYQWISIPDWGNELVMSYFLRCAVRGKTLFVEINRFLLTPLAAKCRSVDAMATIDWKEKWAMFVGSVFVGPLSVIRSAFMAIGKFQEGIERLFDSKERARRHQIEHNPLYNYGAQTSVRQSFSTNSFNHYFQKLDGDFYTKVLEHEILDAIVGFLDEHNVDTSELRERRTLILNSGIIVKGGDVTAESLAVGAGATSVKAQSTSAAGKKGANAKGAAA